MASSDAASAAPMLQVGDDVWYESPSGGADGALYLRGEIVPALVSTPASSARVSFDDGEARDVPMRELLAANPRHADTADDLGELSVLNDPCTLHAIASRFLSREPHERIYTRAGGLLVAVNPFRLIPPLRDARCERTYALGTRDVLPGDASGLPPHLFEVAGVAYASLMRAGEAQSIVVSGESGAGKTESCKLCLHFFAVAAELLGGSARAATARGAALCAQLLESGPLLEAFGNAKTQRNDNSSRFGRLIEVCLDGEGRVAGGALSHYLLEQARVVEHAHGERSFHVFYQLCARAHAPRAHAAPERAADDEMLSELGLLRAGGYACLLPGAGLEGLRDAEGGALDDAAACDDTLARLERLLPSRGARTALLSVVAACLWLSEVGFVAADADGERAEVEGGGAEGARALEACARLLRVDAPALGGALCERQIAAGGEVCRVPKSVPEARDSCDALAKALYSRLFDHVVTALNAALSEAGHARGAARHEGRRLYVLDIFGFEAFDTNGFEQLCINYANERLHALFHRAAILRVRAEYEAEGVALPEAALGALDNSAVLELLEARPAGILPLLNEECMFPSNDGASFVTKLAARHGRHPAFSTPRVRAERPLFGVRHYALPVTYDASDFLAKNKDALYAELSALMADSGAPLVRALFGSGLDAELARAHSHVGGAARAASSGGGGGGGAAAGGSAARRREKRRGAAAKRDASAASDPGGGGGGGRAQHLIGVAAAFSDALAELLGLLGGTQVHFVRCVKPNHAGRARSVDAALVRRQLACAGLVDAVRVARGGYPSRLALSEFARRFAPLAAANRPTARPGGGGGGGGGGGLRARCEALCLAAGLPSAPAGGSYLVGTSRVFLAAGVLARLERQLRVRLGAAAAALQATWRARRARLAFGRARHAVRVLRAAWRAALQRRAALAAREQRAAALAAAGARASASAAAAPTAEPVRDAPTSPPRPALAVPPPVLRVASAARDSAPPHVANAEAAHVTAATPREEHAHAVAACALRLSRELAELQALALSPRDVGVLELERQLATRDDELHELTQENAELSLANEELYNEVLELRQYLVPTKLRLAHAEDEKAALARELRKLKARCEAAERELGEVRDAAGTASPPFNFFFRK